MSNAQLGDCADSDVSIEYKLSCKFDVSHTLVEDGPDVSDQGQNPLFHKSRLTVAELFGSFTGYM